MIHLINFADEHFKDAQQRNSSQAIRVGRVDKVWEFSPKDISKEFKLENSNIFSNKRGCGLWLWKPYFITELLNKLPDGDIIIYSDAGVSFIREVSPLVDILNKTKNGLLFFGLPLLNVEWTKKETFIEAAYQPSKYENQVDGSFFLIKVCDEAKSIIKEWFELSKNEKALSPSKFDSNINDYPRFQKHREDQSTLSIVINKNNIGLYRDPSDYGEFPFQYKSKKWTYCPVKYTNSPYSTITLHHRRSSIKKYKRIYQIKHILSRVGLWNEWIFNLKNKVINL